MRRKALFVYLAVDLGGTNIRAAVVNHTGTILHRIQIPTPAEKGAEQVLNSLCELMKRILQDYGSYYSIQAIGIGSPGCIDVETGTVLFATQTLPGWKGTNLRKVVETKFHLPVFVDNDANAAAYGEKCYGVGKNTTNFITLTIGTGVGGGIIIDNEVYRGYQFYAGEIGHMIICYNGPACNCGSSGCLESYLGAPALVKNTQIALRSKKNLPQQEWGAILRNLVDNDLDQLTPKIICQAARKKDLLAQQIIADAGYYLGVGLSSLINLFSPEKIAIGGGIAQAGNLLLNPARKVVKNHTLFIAERNIPILPAQLGPDAGLIGAAMLAKKYIHP